MDHAALSPRPAWRGRLHQVAFFVSVPAGVALVAAAGTALARVGAVIYAVSLSGMYAASAAFHRIDWGPRPRRWMRRLDHSMIYMLIAGTYTPFSLLVLEGSWSVVMLSVVWTGALFGIVWKLSTSRLPALGAALYIVLGWVAIVALPNIVGRLSVVQIVLLFTGGVLYTAGSVILLRRRPDPNPTVFGYHEVWHSLVIAASVCHYALILMIVL
jgi:hemolysin III